MVAIELVQAGSRAPNTELTKRITRFCLEHGVILVTAGTYSNVIRLLMPLVITDEQFEEALGVMESALQEVCAAQPTESNAPVAVA
jgi:4-aminobutyrate aminotransferase/(S)-3-amino-2-methylpropionate transaminase